jgi:hypothetical protein
LISDKSSDQTRLSCARPLSVASDRRPPLGTFDIA